MDNNLKTTDMDDQELKNIYQILLSHNFESTAGTLTAEAVKKGFKSFEKNCSTNNEIFVDPYEQILCSYKAGDRKNFFKLWNSLIPENIQQTIEYKIMTLNLYVHFAVLPKRTFLYWFKKTDNTDSDNAPSMMSLNRNDFEYKERENFINEIEKNGNDGMEELREYLNTTGKVLEHDIRFRPFFALPFIEDPYGEPFLCKIFEEGWLDELTENLHLFLNKQKRNMSNVVLVKDKSNEMTLINESTSDKSEKGLNTNAQKETIKNNVPIIPNDRNIPIFLEDNEISEQYSLCDSVKLNQKSRGTQTSINTIGYSTNSSREDIYSPSFGRHDKRLIQCSQELAITKSHLCTVHSNYEKLKLRFHKLHADYHKLISISGELTAALENSVKGQNVDLQAMLETCIKIFPDLFNQNIRDNSQLSSALQLDKSYASMKLSEHSISNAISISPKLLDFKKIKLHLINGNVKTKLFLLQALRRKITLGQPGERDEAIHEYISKDLLGLHGQIASDNGMSILPYLLAPENIITPHPLQQSAARLLNVLASFRCGRDYLSFGSIVVNVIFKCLSNNCDNDIDGFTCNMMIATLQKLSLRKQQRIYMIECGLVEWLIGHLHTQCGIMDFYQLEYATALLMNLSLHRMAQKRASSMASLLISTLLTLLSIDHTSALPYVNGSLNNFLSNELINEEAKRMQLSSVLEHYRKHKTGEIRKHLDQILKLHRGESTINTEDEETADDDNEEFDILESELEENDPVKNYSGDLCGEALLATCYTISANASKDRQIISNMSLIKHSKINRMHNKPQQQGAISHHEQELMHCNKNVLPRSPMDKIAVLRNGNKNFVHQNSPKNTAVDLHLHSHRPKLVSSSSKDQEISKTEQNLSLNTENNLRNSKSLIIYKNGVHGHFHGQPRMYHKSIQSNINSAKSNAINKKSILDLSSSSELQERIDNDILRNKKNKSKSFKSSHTRQMHSVLNSSNKDCNRSAVYLYANDTSKESSKMTILSSMMLSVASEGEPTDIEKLSSIASL